MAYQVCLQEPLDCAMRGAGHHPCGGSAAGGGAAWAAPAALPAAESGRLRRCASAVHHHCQLTADGTTDAQRWILPLLQLAVRSKLAAELLAMLPFAAQRLCHGYHLQQLYENE